jgi:hypothetical protein
MVEPVKLAAYNELRSLDLAKTLVAGIDTALKLISVHVIILVRMIKIDGMSVFILCLYFRNS